MFRDPQLSSASFAKKRPVRSVISSAGAASSSNSGDDEADAMTPGSRARAGTASTAMEMGRSG
eukprot:scaffold294818_cov48-Prasinocladus_malaysianus.AAC.1